MSAFWNRRSLLRTTGTGIAGMTMLSTGGTAAEQEDSKASITFNDQTTDGTSVTVARFETSVYGEFRILDSDSNSIAGPIEFDSGTTVNDYEVELNQPITESETLSANFYEDGSAGVARDLAEITVEDPPELLSGMEPTLIEADPDAGFNYPFYLYAPPMRADSDQKSILVQPNNSGEVSDSLDVQKQAAQQRIESSLPRTISERLSVPLLIPVFPRPQSEPVDGQHYIHALDRQTMQISGGPLERVDLQLLRMVDHAQEMLSEQSYPVDDQLLLNGFSASGNFVDRFTFLHPDRVRSVTAGGLNGTAMLPLEEAEGHTLNFHIGIADVEELTGDPVDLDALNDVNQFLYMGEEDSNDTIPYDDAWSDEMREIALDVYGEKMVTDRFPYCQSAYEDAGIEAQFKVYEGAGHTPSPALGDIVEFHQRSLDGEDVSEFNQNLGFEPVINHTAEQSSVGEPIEFDSSATETALGEALAYIWEFPNGETAAGKTVTHEFKNPGQYTVKLKVIDNNGRTATTETTIGVGDQTEQSTTPTESTNESAATASSETNQASSQSDPETNTPREDTTTPRITLPGVGLGVVVTSTAGGLYSLKNRLQE